MLNLISRATVKTHLGISSNLYDDNIDMMIPIVSADIRRILNNKFDKYVLAIVTSGSTDIDFGVNTRLYYDEGMYFPKIYPLGQVVYSSSLAAETYLSSINPVTGIYTLSAAATADGDYVIPTINISQFPTIAKMIWYKILCITTDGVGERAVKSESYGGISKTYADTEINKQFNYPATLLSDLGPAYAEVS